MKIEANAKGKHGRQSDAGGIITHRNLCNDIWKVGLNYNAKELDVVFGDLAPEQLIGSVLKQGNSENVHGSIIIPNFKKKSQPFKEGGDGYTELFGSIDHPFSNKNPTLNNGLGDIKNKKFKEYFKRYFPRENIIIKPMETIAKDFYKTSREIQEEYAHQSKYPDFQDDLDIPNRLTMREKLLKIFDVESPSQSEMEENNCETPESVHLTGKEKAIFPKQDYMKILRDVDCLSRNISEQNSNGDKKCGEWSKINSARQNNMGDSSIYHKNVMEYFSRKKQIRRTQRKENMSKIRELGFKVDALPLLALTHHNKDELPPPYKNTPNRSIRNQQRGDFRSNSTVRRKRSAEIKTPQYLYSEGDALIGNVFSLLSHKNREFSSACDTKNRSFSQLSPAWMCDRRNSISALKPNRKSKSCDLGQKITYNNLPYVLKQLEVEAKHSIKFAQKCLIRALLPRLALVGKFGSPTKISPYKGIHRLRRFHTLLLEQKFVQMLEDNKNNDERRCALQQHEHDLNISYLPSWERKYFGLHDRQRSEQVVIACLKPLSDFASWLEIHRK